MILCSILNTVSHLTKVTLHFCESFFTYPRLRKDSRGSEAVGQWERKGCEDETVGRWQAGSMGGWEEESMRGWEDERTGSKREEGNGKDGERKQTKPYTTIPSRGFAPGKLPLDRPHQGAAVLTPTKDARKGVTFVCSEVNTEGLWRILSKPRRRSFDRFRVQLIIGGVRERSPEHEC